MPQLKCRGIVIRYADYKENDRILTLLTGEYGLVTVSARGCRRAKSRLLQGSELFVYAEYVLSERNDKYYVDSCDVLESYYSLREDISKFGAASYMLSIANEAHHANEMQGELMSLLLYSLSFVAYSENNSVDIAVCFAIKALKLMGFMPYITNCAICGADVKKQQHIVFSGEFGGSLCEACERTAYRDGMKLSPLSLEAMRRMLLLEAADIRKVILPENVRNELRQAVNTYAERMLEKKLKAFECLI